MAAVDIWLTSSSEFTPVKLLQPRDRVLTFKIQVNCVIPTLSTIRATAGGEVVGMIQLESGQGAMISEVKMTLSKLDLCMIEFSIDKHPQIQGILKNYYGTFAIDKIE